MATFSTLVWIVGLLCAVWVIYDVLTTKRRLSTGVKVLWIIFALLFSIIAAIVYYFVYKYKK